MAAALTILTLAIAQPTLVELGNTGKLLARDAATAVSVDVTCTDTTTEASVFVTLVQRLRGGRITRGSESEAISGCNSHPDRPSPHRAKRHILGRRQGFR